MCRIERTQKTEMALKSFGESKIEKVKSSVVSRSRMKLWIIRGTTSILLWTCIVQLTALGDMWGPKVLKGWPSCFTQDIVLQAEMNTAPARFLPPKSWFKNCLFILISVLFIHLYFSLMFLLLSLVAEKVSERKD